jgi:lipoprotein-anchoring transpeptidase ErfK/SrfK
MRLLASFPQFRSLLAVPFLAVMLVFPASAEPNPDVTRPQVESTPDTVPAGPNSGPAEQKSEDTAPDATGEAKPEDSNAATGEAKPEGTDPSPDAAATETPKSTVLVNIDKASQEMTVFVDGVELYTWPVSTGIRGYSTPSGTYTTSSMNEIWYSKQWDNAPMPHAVFFTKKGHAIHGTLEEKKLGKAASHGCVRLSRENAKTLYQLVEATGLENTQVVLSGETPGGEAQVASQRRNPEAYPPWFEFGEGYYPKPGKKRRGLFGKRWFQPYGPQGYYAPRGNYRPRGLSPRDY